MAGAPPPRGGSQSPSKPKDSAPVRGDDKTNLNPIGTWVRQAKRGNRKATRNLQRWLRSQGYGVKVDGKWGPQTRSAYRWYRKGNTASKWASPKVKRQNNPRNRFNATPIAGPNPRARGGGGGGGRPKGGKRKGGKGRGFAGAIGGIDAQFGGRGSFRTGKKLSINQWADQMAGLQFDPQIRDIKTLIARLGPRNEQAINDITDWYGDTQELNARAGQRAGDIYEAGAARQDDAIANLIQSLGGGGNDAMEALAATNLRDTGYQRAMGGIEEMYHEDMSPILAAAAASAKQREQRLNLEMMQDYQLQLADLMGQRGQAEAAARFEGGKYNNDLAQQWFQNRLAQTNAALGAQAAGLDMAVKREQIASSRAQRRAAGGGKFVQWAKLNPVERSQLLTTAVYKPDGTRRPLAAAQNYLVSMGYAAGAGGRATKTSNAAILAALRTFYS